MMKPATLTAAQPLELRSGADAAAFLGRLPMADPVRTHEALTRFFTTLARHPLPPLEQAPVLAQAEKALAFVQDEATRRYLSRPLPYAGQELALFQRTVQLWQDAADAWLAAEPPAGSDADTAAVLERALFCRGMALAEHLEARFQIPDGLWQSFHAIYAESERRQVADLVFQDPKGRSLSCARSYAAVLLFDLSKPYSLRSRDIPVVWRWSRALAQLVQIASIDAGEPAPFVIDLESDRPVAKPLPSAILGPQVRRLVTADLASHMRKLRRRLAEAVSPADLQLGDEVSPGDAQRLLAHLKYPWSQEAIARAFDLRQPIGTAEVVLGYEAIHYRLTGREMHRPKAAAAAYQYSRQDAERLAVFGTARDDASSVREEASQRYSGETWTLLEQSAHAFRLYRPEGGARVAVGQLAAISGEDGQLVLTRLSSLMQTGSGGVVAKAKRLPGLALGVAVTALGANLPLQASVGGFIIQPVGADPGALPDLVLPRGWYLKNRPVELEQGQSRRYRLDKVVFSGHDFDLVSCGSNEAA